MEVKGDCSDDRVGEEGFKDIAKPEALLVLFKLLVLLFISRMVRPAVMAEATFNFHSNIDVAAVFDDDCFDDDDDEGL